MSKTIIINDRYSLVFLENRHVIKRDEVRVAFVYDTKEHTKVLYLHVVEDLSIKEHQTVCLTNRSFSVGKDKKAGLVLIDKLVYFLDFVVTTNGPTMLMHELGHCLNGDLEKCDIDYSKNRRNLLKKGVLMESECKADEFAVKECGIENFLKSLEWMEATRKHVFSNNSGESLRLALFEFEKRREHAIEYAKTLS